MSSPPGCRVHFASAPAGVNTGRVTRGLHFCVIASDPSVTLAIALGLCKFRPTDVQLVMGRW
jgi:hypothetical protein